MSHKFPLDLINQEIFPDFNYIPYASHEQTPFLINHIFLNKKRLPSEKSLFEHRANNTKEISDAINEVFNKDNELEEEKESTYDKSIELNKKKPFKTIKLEAPGRKSKKLNKKNFSNKKTHDKYSQDNIITKIQVHYINFLTNLANDIISEVSDKKKVENKQNFKNIKHKYKIYYNYNNFQELKEQSIKDIIIKPISKRKKLTNDNYNEEIYNELINKSNILDKFLEKKYLSLFYNYYNNGEKLDKIIIYNKEIKLSKNTKSFCALINKKQNKNDKMKNLMIDCINVAFLN